MSLWFETKDEGASGVVMVGGRFGGSDCWTEVVGGADQRGSVCERVNDSAQGKGRGGVEDEVGGEGGWGKGKKSVSSEELGGDLTVAHPRATTIMNK